MTVKPDTLLIAIDPGDEHVGVAFFTTDEDDKWYCQDAMQLTPDEFYEAFAETVLDPLAPPIVVYERFRLYADKAQLQKGSEFKTAQMIGVIKYICRVRNGHAAKHEQAESEGKMVDCELVGGMCADPTRPRVQPVELVGQMADIKKPTTGILRHKKIKSVGKAAKKENPGWGDHCIDAELHGWHHILKTMKGEPAL